MERFPTLISQPEKPKRPPSVEGENFRHVIETEETGPVFFPEVTWSRKFGPRFFISPEAPVTFVAKELPGGEEATKTRALPEYLHYLGFSESQADKLIRQGWQTKSEFSLPYQMIQTEFKNLLFERQQDYERALAKQEAKPDYEKDRRFTESRENLAAATIIKVRPQVFKPVVRRIDKSDIIDSTDFVLETRQGHPLAVQFTTSETDQKLYHGQLIDEVLAIKIPENLELGELPIVILRVSDQTLTEWVGNQKMPVENVAGHIKENLKLNPEQIFDGWLRNLGDQLEKKKILDGGRYQTLLEAVAAEITSGISVSQTTRK